MERKKASDYPQELLNLFDRYVCTVNWTGAAFWRGLRSSPWEG